MLETVFLSLHIVKRNWLVYRKDFLANISPTIADPAWLMLSLGLGLGSYIQQVEGMTYLQFLAPGLAISTAFFTAFFESSYGFFVRLTYENIFKAMLTTPIGVREIFLGEIIWVGLKGALMTFCVSLVLFLCDLMPNPIYLPLMALIGFLVAIPFGAIGLISVTLVKNINQFQTIYSFLISPIYFMSGIFFPLESLNKLILPLFNIFPLIHAVKLAQAIFQNNNILQTFMIYVPILMAQSIIYCLIAYNRVRNKLIS